MPIIKEAELKNTLKPEKLLPVYILFGRDSYLKKLYSDKILKLVTTPDDVFNYNKFETGCDLQEVSVSVDQMPFMADKRFVEICDFDFEHASKSDLDRLNEILKDVPDTTVLILRFDAIEIDPKSSKFNNLVKSAQQSGGVAVDLGFRSKAELSKMLTDAAAKRGSVMDRSVADYLIELAGDDINTLSNEITKLSNFKKGEKITRETVDLVSVKTVEASVFKLAEFILNCDATSAVKLLDELLFMRIEPIVILATVSSVYIDIMRVHSAKSSGLGIKEVAEIYPSYKSKMFVLEKASRHLNKSFDSKKIHLSLMALKEADEKLKSVKIEPRIILESLIIKLVYIIAKGESID